MSKFKKGDKVRITSHGNWNNKIGTINRQLDTTDGSEWYEVEVDGERRIAHINGFEKYWLEKVD